MKDIPPLHIGIDLTRTTRSDITLHDAVNVRLSGEHIEPSTYTPLSVVGKVMFAGVPWGVDGEWVVAGSLPGDDTSGYRQLYVGDAPRVLGSDNEGLYVSTSRGIAYLQGRAFPPKYTYCHDSPALCGAAVAPDGASVVICTKQGVFDFRGGVGEKKDVLSDVLLSEVGNVDIGENVVIEVRATGNIYHIPLVG